ncbi:amidohydrolase [Curtobacterium sp. MWU13-2055]|uniref:amidohydrolase n=1 Tax=Curtobacterium sp. MWU13-2055 TaxID=2931928 RepID=UPI00200EE5A6|nr:amidohydrolase family protein [Curtobacterium sp. MWU13-2055]
MNATAELIIEAQTDTSRAAVAVRGGRIVAVAADAAGVDALHGTWRGDSTSVFLQHGVLAPLFVDTHNHLALASRNVLGVPMHDVRTIDEILDRIQERAAHTPAGSWVITAADWHEMQLQERRFPTATELDEAAPDHLVLVQRGGHNAVLNSAALAAAGVTATSGDVADGYVARADDGTPTGLLQDGALTAMQSVLPEMSQEDLIKGIEATSCTYRAAGVGVVRDPAVSVEEWGALQRARSENRLHVRAFSMIFSPATLIAAAGSMDDYLDGLEAKGIHPDDGDDLLRLWGIKLVVDGGVEAAALREPYADRPDFTGTLLMTPDALTDALRACVTRGWPVGTHACGDAGVDAFLDAVQRNVGRGIQHEHGQVVMEHGALMDADQIARAIALDVHITAQEALRNGLIAPFVEAWGQERAAAMFPWRELLNAGASVSAGTDHPISPLDPIAGVLGMTTRRTTLGILGAEHACTRDEALELYTRAGAELLGHDLTGTITVGAPADFAVYPVDLHHAPDEALADAHPTLSVLAGEVLHHQEVSR